MTWLLVALGAAVGAPLRYVAGHLLDGRLPTGTILVNWAGTFLLGWLSGLGLGGHALALLGTGFCGALTTYSSFAVQTHDRGPRLGAVNVVVTLVPALLLCGLGFAIGSAGAAQP
ncbi:MAG: CrcB family protein [Nocardioidaceae bacterium]